MVLVKFSQIAVPKFSLDCVYFVGLNFCFWQKTYFWMPRRGEIVFKFKNIF